MPFQSALTSGQLEALRGTASIAPSFVSETYISLCPNTTVFKTTLSATPATASFAQVTFGATLSGSAAAAKVGQTVIISATDNQRAAVFVGRVRKVVSGSTLYLNETSASLASGYYLWVIDDYRIWNVLPRQNSGVPNMDYDVTFRQLKPVFSGVDSDYAAFITGASKTYSFPVTILPTASGASISSFSWDISDGTLVSGSLTGSGTNATISASFPAGFRHIHLTATDSNGVANILHIRIFVHSSSYAVQLLTHGDVQVDGELDGGWSASVTAFAELSSVLDNTAVCVWTINKYNGTETSISSNIAFVGRLRSAVDSTSADEVHSVHLEARLVIESPSQQLARIQIVSYELRDNASPTIFGDIKNLTIWRGVVFLISELSTFTSLHALAFDSTADTFRFFGTATPAGNILNAVNDLADSINAALQMNAAGRAEVVGDLRIETTANRNAAVTVFGHTTADIINIQRTRQHVRAVGKLEASGGTFNSTSRLITAVFSLAPGVAQDYPEGQASLTRQVLAVNIAKATAQSELNTRSGHAFEKAQQADEISVTYPPGYWWLTPARNQWYAFTLASSDTISGLALTTATRWLCISVSVTHEIGSGSKQVTATFTKETSGAAGQTVIPPDIGESPYRPPIIPTIPIIPAFPVPLDPILPPAVPYTGGSPPGSPVVQGRTDGNTLVYFNDNNQVFVTREALMRTNPVWTEITPALDAGYDIRDIEVIGRRLLVLTENNTNTIVYNRPSFFDPSQASTAGGTIGGLYEQIKRAYIAGVPGAAYIAGPIGVGDGAAWSQYINFTETSGGYSPYSVNYPSDPGPDTNFGLYYAGAGWGNSGVSAYDHVVYIAPYPRGTTLDMHLTSVTLTASSVPGESGYPGLGIWLYKDGVAVFINSVASVATYTWTFDLDVDFFVLIAQLRAHPSGTITAKIINVTINGTGPNPYPNSIATAYSDDYFTTAETPQVVGAKAVGQTGLDTIKAGDTVIAGSSGLTNIALSAGGAYNIYGTLLPIPAYPIALWIPRNPFGTTTGNSNINTDTPQYLLVSGTLAAGSLTVWKVISGTLTSITPSVNGTYGIGISPHCAVMADGKKVLSILAFGGTRRLTVTTDTGASWKNTATNVSGLADYITHNPADLTKKQAFFANGTNIGYVRNYQAATLTVANIPSGGSSTILGVRVYSGL